MSRVGGEARSRYDDDWYDELPIATDESKRRRKTVSRYSSRSGLLRTEDAPGRFDGSRFTDSMVAGALAGLAVDGALFPMDTLKTRLQSPAGFRASGGFANLYRGIGVCLMGSAPCSALFFSTFEAAEPSARSRRRVRRRSPRRRRWRAAARRGLAPRCGLAA